jgi:CO/xanthine dehydrogenase Mo-binding subunit
MALRGAGWVEAAVLVAAATGRDEIVSPSGGRARATFAADGSIDIEVHCGEPLDDVVLRSYCVGAAHMALGWVRSEGIAVDEDGRPLDLTVRSFGILRARDMPDVRVTIAPDLGEPVNGSDAVFAAVALAAWKAEGLAPEWPTRRGPQ